MVFPSQLAGLFQVSSGPASAARPRRRYRKSPGRELRDFVFFPVRAAVLEDRVPMLGLTPLRQERIDACLPYVKGRLLDVGCGENLLVKAYQDGPGVGVDVFPWPGVNALCDSRRLPFKDASFDTAALIACLNHIPDREIVLREVHRALVPGGRLLVTMIDPFVGYWAHKVTHVLGTDPDGCERERKEGEPGASGPAMCSSCWMRPGSRSAAIAALCTG